MGEGVVTQRRVAIENSHGEKLVGVLHETGNKGLVILCHGFRCSKDEKLLLNLADVLASEGISTFRFDFAGNGESEGSFQYGNLRGEAEELHAVINYFLGEQRQVSAIVGHSKGGDVVLLYASLYHDINVIVNISGRFSLQKGIEDTLGKDFMQRIKEAGFIDVKEKNGQEYRLTLESLMDHLSTDMHTASLSIDKDCRVLTIHGSLDEINPVDDAMEFAKVIANHKLHIIEGANHSYTNHQAKLGSTVLEFIRSSQVGDASAREAI